QASAATIEPATAVEEAPLAMFSFAAMSCLARIWLASPRLGWRSSSTNCDLEEASSPRTSDDTGQLPAWFFPYPGLRVQPGGAGVAVFVGAPVGTEVAVPVGVAVAVRVDVGVAVAVRVAVRVAVAVLVRVAVAV